MKRFYLLSLMALVSAFAPAFLSAKTIILKQIAVTPLEGDTMFFNIDEYEKATFELTQTSPASRYLMLRRNDGAAVRIYLDEVKGITYKETTQTIDDPIEAPKVGDYYYSDGTWSDGGLISINADGTSPYGSNYPWALLIPGEFKYPVEGLTIGMAKGNTIGGAYLGFSSWARDRYSSRDWYNKPQDSEVVYPLR